jgi:hypothetical protein
MLCVAAVCSAFLLLPAAASAITVSGTAMKDELGNTWQGCNGTTANIRVIVGTTSAGTTTCNTMTGTFSLSGVTIPAIGSRVLVYFDGATAKGALYTTAASTGADITGLTPTQDRVWIRSEQAAPTLDDSLVFGYDQADDPDIPVAEVNSGVTWLELDTGMELHIDGGITFDMGGDYTSVGSMHVESAATFVPGDWGAVSMSNNGTLGCTLGPGTARPFCLEAGATVPPNNSHISYDGQTGTYVIEPGTWHTLSTYGYRGSLGIIGYAAGQTLTIEADIGLHSSVTSDPWATDVNAYYIYLDGYTRDPNNDVVSPAWTGRSAFTITVNGGFDGGGNVDLPAADVDVAGKQGRIDFGPREGIEELNDWEFKSVLLHNSGYDRSPWGVGATGTTAAVNSPTGTPLDTPIAIGQDWCGVYAAYQLGQNSGDWGIVRYDEFGVVDTTFDDGDAAPADNILVFNSGGVDVPWALNVDQCNVTVVGSSAGNWMLRQYASDGTLNWSRTWDGGGTDEARSIAWSQGNLFVAGSGGATLGWRVREYDTTGTFVQMQSFNNGGVQAEARAICNGDPWGGRLYVIGRVGVAGSRDWAVKALFGDGSGWDTFNGVAAGSAWTWNPGGTEDDATACSASSDFLFVGGTTGTGANDDIRVRAFWNDGTPLSSWAGGTGIRSINNAGDDELWSILADRWADNITVAGRNGASGQATLWRYDADGDLDTSWGTSGSIAWADQAATALFMNDASELLVGTRLASNGGDGAIRRYDYAGDLTTAYAPGTLRVLMRNGPDGKGKLTVNDDFQVGASTDAAGAATLADLESYDTRVQSRNTLTVKLNSGKLRASSSQPLSSRNDLSIYGTFWPNTGDVRIENQSHRAELKVSPGTQFNNLSIVSGEKMVAFDEVDPIKVKGTFYVRGTSCAAPIQLKSVVGGNPWDLDLTGGGSVDVQWAEILDSNALSAVTATNSRNLGGNTNWTIAGCGGSAFFAPNGMQVDGQFHPVSSNPAPLLSWFNRVGASTDRVDAEVYSSSPANQVALWRLDGTGADSAGTWTLTPNAGVTWPAGRFNQGASATSVSPGLDGGDLDMLGDYTIDGWVKTTLPGAYDDPDIIYKGNGTGSLINSRIGFQKSTNQLQAEMTVNGGTDGATVVIDATPVLDGAWHHVASTYSNGRLSLYVDGELERSAWPQNSTSFTPDNVAAGVVLGYQLGGDLDDWRILNEAATPAEIRGFYRTGRRHFDLLWDADPGNSAGVAYTSCGNWGSFSAPPCGNNARSNITYGGPASDLRLDGARYWVRARTRSTGLQWSNWSDYDFWDVDQSMTAAVTSGATVALGGGGAQLPGADAVGTATFQVTTTNVHGYSAYVAGPSDAWAMSDGLAGANHQIPGFGTAGATPGSWAAGAPGFGVSVVSATAGKDTSRWGTGIDTSNLALLKWSWGSATSPLLLHARSAYDPAAQQVGIAVRANAPPATDPGQYTTTLVFTAVPNV